MVFGFMEQIFYAVAISVIYDVDLQRNLTHFAA